MPEPEPRLTAAPGPAGPAGPVAPRPRLIRGYLGVLAARLPASIAEELAGGLTETYESCLSRGLAPSAAAEAAVAEFGPAEEIAMAALGRRYRPATATGMAGCCGYAALGAALIIAAVFLLAPVGWVTAVAITASAARIAVAARLLRPALAR